MSRIRSTFVALALLCPLTTACDSNEGVEDDLRSVEDFNDGMICDSDQGAFRVTLWSDSGEIEVGRNDLVVHVGMYDPMNAEGPGRGIPNANIDLDAWMPTGDTAMGTEPRIEALGDGQYRIENVVLSEQGVWNFDFALTVGDNMHESLSLAFSIED